MAQRWARRATVTFAAMSLVAGCAIISPTNELSPVGDGTGGGTPFDTSVHPATTAGSGGILVGDAGGDAATYLPLTSYQYLCGGSQAACLPGFATDLCAPGGNPGIGGGSPNTSTYSCQLVASDGGPVSAQCGSAGPSADGDTCSQTSDCGAELGCIGTDVTSICRPYCCDGLETCPANTYCVAAPMADAPDDMIPVCVPTMTCALLDPSSPCPTGTACAIVRESGATSCITPGDGVDGSPCPCAAGFTCSWAEGTCVELCHTGSAECGAGRFCQGGLTPYPDGIGYCVSY